jgi:hypothetical protein
MGRIVIPRPRADTSPYRPKYVAASTERPHKFGPQDIALLMKMLDAAVAIGGKVAGAVGRTQEGPRAAEAQGLADARQRRVSAAVAQEEERTGQALTAEQKDQVRRTTLAAEPTKRAAARELVAEGETLPSVQAFLAQEGVTPPILDAQYQTQGLFEPAQRTGRAIVAGGEPVASLPPETIDNEFNRGFADAMAARRAAMERGAAASEDVSREFRTGGLPAIQRVGILEQHAPPWSAPTQLVGPPGGPTITGPEPVPQWVQERVRENPALAPYVPALIRLGQAQGGLWSSPAPPPPQQVATAPAPAPGPPPASAPPAAAQPPTQVMVIDTTFDRVAAGGDPRPAVKTALQKAIELQNIHQRDTGQPWPTAWLRRQSLGTLQALGTFATTPERRAQLMEAIRQSPDVQPTSVSDLLGMGKDHIVRAQAPALTAMRGAKGFSGGPKSTVDLARKLYDLQLAQAREKRAVAKEQRASELHPGKITKQQQDIEAAGRKAELEKRTRDAVIRQKLAAARKAEAEATKRERDAERDLKRAKNRGGARYKRSAEDAKVEGNITAWLRIDALATLGKPPTEELTEKAGPLAGKTAAEVQRYHDTHYSGRRDVQARSVRLGRSLSRVVKPPRTPSEGGVPWGARKELLRLDRVYTFYETALLNKDSQAAKDITAELGRPPTHVDLANIRNERAELSAEIDKLRQRGRSAAPAEQSTEREQERFDKLNKLIP